MEQEKIDILAETLLLEVITQKVEMIEQLPIMLKGIDYLDGWASDSKTTECEIFESDALSVMNFFAVGEKFLIELEMPCLISTWQDREQLLRITTTVKAKCLVSHAEVFDWNNMNKIELLNHQKDVQFVELNYIDTECDDIRAY
ncbi:hypothetical protein OCA18_25515 [Bacillus cereus]|uniref:hypothetical protein n=2 Tax=Bacillus thuringiensis TaxID=1428 RepID=UPI0015D4A2B7|nr:hypothetical protein [Bacillus thuringiensis]MCU5131782.1 hypothetical protein [Bacillus cereus]